MVDLTWSVNQGQLLRRGFPPDAEVEMLNTDFNSYPVSDPMSITDFRTAMGNFTGGGAATVARTAIIAEPGRGNVLIQYFHAGMIGPEDGIAASIPLAYPVEEATITYDVRFRDADFDWGKGGKLPGLGGVVPGFGNPPSGGSPSPYGWSCRGMWVTPTSFPGSSNSINEWVGYLYTPTQAPGSYGVNVQTDSSFVADQWHTVTQNYKMNTVAVEGSSGNADGIHRMWLDGVLVHSSSDVVYRIYENSRITHLMWSMFYGGATSDWAPNIDTEIEIDNLRITTPMR